MQSDQRRKQRRKVDLNSQSFLGGENRPIPVFLQQPDVYSLLQKLHSSCKSRIQGSTPTRFDGKKGGRVHSLTDQNNIVGICLDIAEVQRIWD
ncbi:hypothetical protein HanPSC8_Chr16g0695381 [Helianthus annuus]|nr:hypothetical protein HanIR_Chr16g0788931 [Helianthus annuus]KAJ0819376.1 hypothetical protein HanPSC8_Chr16g0695381 [Helianthus annuus]